MKEIRKLDIQFRAEEQDHLLNCECRHGMTAYGTGKNN